MDAAKLILSETSVKIKRKLNWRIIIISFTDVDIGTSYVIHLWIPVNSLHPLVAPTVILFIIGGVSLDECRRLHRAVITSGVDANVIIGSTKIVTSVDAMRDVLRL